MSYDMLYYADQHVNAAGRRYRQELAPVSACVSQRSNLKIVLSHPKASAAPEKGTAEKNQ